MNFNTITKQTGKRVLLYSGGMDSFIIGKLENFDTLLFIDSKSKYSAIEIEFLKRQNLKNLVIDTRLNLKDLEMASAMVPLRNLFFVMIASYYGDEIVLGATSGDRSSDKDEPFANMTGNLLNHIYKTSWWSEGRHINISLKYKRFTKRMLIQEYIRRGFNLKELDEKSFSCYHPKKDGSPCLKCKPCIRKYTSLLPFRELSDDIKLALRSHYTPEVVQKIRDDVGTIFTRGEEDKDTLHAVEEYLY